MKLKNKRTGDIGELQITEKHCAVAVGNGTTSCGIEIYSSLAELNAEWEDVPEEPKEYWYIADNGEIEKDTDDGGAYEERMKEIGNYFETEEEAELALRKLKAWKRLKDFGCRLVLDDQFAVKFVGPDATKITSAEEQKSLSDAYNLLFGGEE